MSQFAKIFEAVKAEPEKKIAPIAKTKKDAVKKIKPESAAKPSSAGNLKKTSAGESVGLKKPVDGNKSSESFKPGKTNVDSLFAAASPASDLLLIESAAGDGNSATPAKKIGKSRHADYTQVLTYIRKDTHRSIKKILIDDAEERDLSDLVEELLREWLNKQENQ